MDVSKEKISRFRKEIKDVFFELYFLLTIAMAIGALLLYFFYQQ